MIKYTLWLLVGLALSGCSGGKGYDLTNDEIIAEVKKCEDAGLTATVQLNSFDTPKKVVCLPLKKGD